MIVFSSHKVQDDTAKGWQTLACALALADLAREVA